MGHLDDRVDGPQDASADRLRLWAAGRSEVTCRNRCGDACRHPVANPTSNPYFGDVAVGALSRRSLLRTAGLGVLTLATVPQLTEVAAGVTSAADGPRRLRFNAVPPNRYDTVRVPDHYDWSVVARWGDPIIEGAPQFDPYAQTPESQAAQFGYNCDYVAVLPVDVDHALMVVNHEYTSEQLMFPSYSAPPTPQQMIIAMMAHGLSVVMLERGADAGSWRLTPEPHALNRRVTASTPITLTGPAAGSDLVCTEADPSGTVVLGTLNNCSGGHTPWGTTLHGEENFQGYFDASGPVDPAFRTAFTRYGLRTTRGTTRGWSAADERFDLALHPTEANRFGWVVELDPHDPASTPAKRTMLGRLKHEGATCRLARDGRAVVYMGDDSRFEYLYKFVSRDPVVPGRDEAARRANWGVLDSGTLYVARFQGDSPPEEIDGSGDLPSDGKFDGSGRWIRLADDTRSYVDGMTLAEVLVNTRLAADRVRPTRMDRPEDVEASPVTGRVYLACTSNLYRTVEQVDEANPRPENKHGHIVEIVERSDDAAAVRFRWQLVVVAGDPEDPATYFAGFDKSKISKMGCPDNLAFDVSGNLWIATNANQLDQHDGLFAMPVEGRQRGYLKQFMSMPRGAECCGPVLTEDERSVFAAVQHPGETSGSTFEDPTSSFPDGDGPPRPSVVVAWHSDGRPIGSR